MSFGQTALLGLLALPLLWMAWEWRHSERHGALLLKVAALSLILLALSEPRLHVLETKLAVALLADGSASVPAGQLEGEQEFIRRIAAARGRNQLQILSFDDSTRPGPPRQQTSLESTGTNLERAIRNAMGSLPPERVPKIALISDGNENAGSVERAIYQARERGIAIDTVPLGGRREPQLQLVAMSAPEHAFSGERFPLELVVESPLEAPATVHLRAEDQTIGRAEVQLSRGRNTLNVRARLLSSGGTLISGEIFSPDLGELRFQHTLSLRTPRALLISNDPLESERHLRQVLGAAGFEVERSPGTLPADLARLDTIIANNQDLEAWPDEQKDRLEEFVRTGGGFLLIAGENNMYEESERDSADALGKMLPADLAPPRTPEGTAVVLVLDKSSSMEGKKMQLARRSAIGMVQNLRRIDRVGILVFDNSFQWAVPLRRNDDPALLQQLISGIIADGGTQIAPALHEAYRQIRDSKAIYKHILLLTDGISEEGDSIALAREASKLSITISTVGLGQDVNRAYLERVAATAEGNSYFLIDVSGLERIVLQDVMQHTGSSVMERAVRPEQLGRAEILEGVPFEAAGPLLGWVKFVAKPRAETLLTVGEAPQDPLLVRWQYGLGRSAVFASDAKARWAVNWVDWPGFDRFWSNLLRDLLPRSASTETQARYDSVSGDLVISYRLSGRAGEVPTETPPDVYVLGSADFRRTASLLRVGAAAYEARIPIENRQGLFRIRPSSDLERFPEIAFFRPNAELQEYGSNEALLRKIAASTGGRFDPSPSEIFDAGGRSVPRQMELWPGLLALAILLNLIELFARKGWLAGLLFWARQQTWRYLPARQ